MTEYERERFELMITGLSIFGMEKEEARFIAMALYNKPDKVEQLMQWMADHPQIDPDKITEYVVNMFNDSKLQRP